MPVNNYSDTDLCVKCGLCLPHCPTYQLTHNENESPRGRLSLIQAWANGDLEQTPTLTQHIENCLTCRTCESMCPAQVPYAQLVNDFRAETKVATNGTTKLAKIILTSNKRTLLNTLLRVFNKIPLTHYLLPSLSRFIPEKVHPNKLAAYYPAINSDTIKTKDHIALFTGCANALFDAKTLTDAIRVLQHCGFNVSVPREQVCCGALDLHAGDKQAYEKLAQTNRQVFDAGNYDAIVSIASGCGNSLSEYAPKTQTKVVDISEFIAPHITALKLNPQNRTAWLHTPCTLKFASPKSSAVKQALSNIQGLSLNTFNTQQACCGAAGLHMISQPQTAKNLLQPIVEQAKQQPADYLLTSNIGCALHISAGLKEAGLSTNVIHPVSLIAQQLEN
jgi:glycolate oxidase iron-sulfur subunit